MRIISTRYITSIAAAFFFLQQSKCISALHDEDSDLIASEDEFNRKEKHSIQNISTKLHQSHLRKRNVIQTADWEYEPNQRFIIKGSRGDKGKNQQIANEVSNTGGKVVMKLFESENGELTVVEIPGNVKSQAFKNRMKSFNFQIAIDHMMYPVSILDSEAIKDETRRSLAQQVQLPWGVDNVFEGTVPPDIPSNVSKSICVVDTGYMDEHPDLPSDITNAHYDTNLDSKDSEGCNYHGTHVAGTIAALKNIAAGVEGVFPGVSDMHIYKVFVGNKRTCGGAPSSEILSAAIACKDSGAKIIQMSIGCNRCYDEILEDGYIDLFENHGILIVASANNSGNSDKSYPASFSGVMSVASINSKNQWSSFSQYNDQVDIAAPGEGIMSTYGTSSYSTKTGTSMSAPHVSGIAALLWNQYPSCSVVEIRDALQNGAYHPKQVERDDYYGHGILRYHPSKEILASSCGATISPSPTVVPPPSPSPTVLPQFDCGRVADAKACRQNGCRWNNRNNVCT